MIEEVDDIVGDDLASHRGRRCGQLTGKVLIPSQHGVHQEDRAGQRLADLTHRQPGALSVVRLCKDEARGIHGLALDRAFCSWAAERGVVDDTVEAMLLAPLALRLWRLRLVGSCGTGREDAFDLARPAAQADQAGISSARLASHRMVIEGEVGVPFMSRNAVPRNVVPPARRSPPQGSDRASSVSLLWIYINCRDIS